MSESKSSPVPRVIIAVLVVAAGAVWLLVLGRDLYWQGIRDSHAEILQPVALKHCQFGRFGRVGDGGYTVCTNLLDQVEAAYSYGVNGEDSFGCQASEELGIDVHQYDCFETTRVVCPGGTLVFHEECVGPVEETVDGLLFDSIENQFARNGHQGKHILFKMDIEGAEIESLLATPPEVLGQIDQLVLEVHGVRDAEGLRMVEYLLEHFHLADVHFNNFACGSGHDPFPGRVYELLLVNKRLDEVDPTREPPFPNPTWAPNNPDLPDCQVQL